ncbi:uncharacterized protein B0H18DRAFT_1006744, partial [Fomitopsis serialis]|uniref:uncharacterized protein n=1 Tax=Fomitopsis serialis TaxID=139415 RepID=UPI0020089190
PGVFFKTCASTTIFSSLRILDVCASSSPLRLVAKGYNTDIGPMLQKPATIESEGSEPSLTLQFLNLHPLDALALLALGLARQRGTPTMHTLIVRGTPLDVSTHVRWRHLFRARPARNLCTLRLIGLPTRSIQECLYVLSYPLKSVEELRAEPLLPHLATLVIVRPVGVFNKQLRKVLGKALETLEVVGVQGRLKTAWRRLRTFCTVKVSEDHAL